MTLEIKHKFVSPKGGGVDPTLIQPSNWNDTHVIQLAADKIIGRASSGAGAAEEITCTAFARSLLACASLAEFLALLNIGVFTTGDVKISLKATGETGWLLMNDGTIGDGSSLATLYADAAALPLYTLIWDNISNSYAPVTGGRGLSAAADFNAHKPMALPKVLGRALAIAGAGASLTSRALGQTLGVESVSLIAAELAAHIHNGSTGGESADHTHLQALEYISVAAEAGSFARQVLGPTTVQAVGNYQPSTAGRSNGHVHNFTTDSGTGLAGAAHQNMQPTSFWNILIKI